MKFQGWVRNWQCTRLSAMCCTRTPHTNAQHKHTHHTPVWASMHTLNCTHTCMKHTCVAQHACQPWPKHVCETPTWLVRFLPIDDTICANSACPKPRRATECPQKSSNNKLIDGKKFEKLVSRTPLNPNAMQRCTSLCKNADSLWLRIEATKFD